MSWKTSMLIDYGSVLTWSPTAYILVHILEFYLSKLVLFDGQFLNPVECVLRFGLLNFLDVFFLRQYEVREKLLTVLTKYWGHY